MFVMINRVAPLTIPKSIGTDRDGNGRRGRWAIELIWYEFDVFIKAAPNTQTRIPCLEGQMLKGTRNSMARKLARLLDATGHRVWPLGKPHSQVAINACSKPGQ